MEHMATFQVGAQTEEWRREDNGYRQKKGDESAVVNVVVFNVNHTKRWDYSG